MDIRRDLIASFIAEHARQLISILALAALGVVLCSVLIPAEIESVRQHLIGFPDSDVFAQKARPIILGAICFIPAIGAIAGNGGTVGRGTLTSNAGFAGTGGAFRLRRDGTNDRALAIAQIVNGQIQVVSPAPSSFGGAGS